MDFLLNIMNCSSPAFSRKKKASRWITEHLIIKSRYTQFIPWESGTGRLCRITCTLEILGNISGPIKASRWIVHNAKEHIQI
jgi:hypothetical protein